MSAQTEGRVSEMHLLDGQNFLTRVDWNAVSPREMGLLSNRTFEFTLGVNGSRKYGIVINT